MIRNSKAITFLPTGLTDGSDQLETFPGACTVLSNLIFNKSDNGSLLGRPGVVELASLASGGFTTPTNIVIQQQIGDYIYGIASTGRFSGYDEPFCFNTLTGTFVPISGVTSSNVPMTAPTTGKWNPPTMSLVATYIVITHPGASGTNYIFWINIADLAAPAWGGGNTTVNGLNSPPIAVGQYNNRAWYLVGNLLYFSDSLLPLQISFPGDALTIGDATPGTAVAGLPLATTTQGILASLLVFKKNSIWQVTGDYALGTLALNQLSSAFGCQAPLTISPVMEGVAFMSQDAIRYVDASSFQVAIYNADVMLPFLNCTEPSRACAAYNNGIYRICLDTFVEGVYKPRADYWLDTYRRKWTGPHSFAYTAVTPYGLSFLLAASSPAAAMIQSDVVVTTASQYRDNGLNYTCTVTTTNVSDTGEMAVKAIIESTIDLGVQVTSTTYTVSAVNDNGVTLGSANVVTPAAVSATNLWGNSLWGVGTWTATPAPYDHTFTIGWPNPIVYRKISFNISATASGGVNIERMFFREQVLNLTNLDVGAYAYTPPLQGALLQDNGAYILQDNGYRILL